MATENLNITSDQKSALARTFSRNSGLPLDETAIFDSLEDIKDNEGKVIKRGAKSYAKTSTAYVGQYIAVRLESIMPSEINDTVDIQVSYDENKTYSQSAYKIPIYNNYSIIANFCLTKLL